MGRFFAGFVVATLLWGGAAAVYLSGILSADPPPIEPADASPDAVEEEQEPQKAKRRKRRRGRRRARKNLGDDGNKIVSSGDELGDNGPRELDMSQGGGEEQLSSAQIDQAFGQAMGRIRRCVLLVPDQMNPRGRVTFAMRIKGGGRVARVRLTGPSGLTAGECGGCMRRAARNISFPSFDGPDMTVRYPVTFE